MTEANRPAWSGWFPRLLQKANGGFVCTLDCASLPHYLPKSQCSVDVGFSTTWAAKIIEQGPPCACATAACVHWGKHPSEERVWRVWCLTVGNVMDHCVRTRPGKESCSKARD